MNELIAKIEKWAEDRNIIKGSKPIDQAMKLFSEFGELADNVGKGRDCRDDIGDVFVVLTIISKQMGGSINIENYHTQKNAYASQKEAVHYLASYLYSFVCEASNLDKLQCLNVLDWIAKNNGYTLQECVQIAYNDIKDRVGILWNGVFVKNTDANYNEVKSMFEKSIQENFEV